MPMHQPNRCDVALPYKAQSIPNGATMLKGARMSEHRSPNAKPNGNPAPKIEIYKDEYLILNGEVLVNIEDDDAELRKFLRKCVPELWEVMKPWHDRLKAGEKLTLLELFAMLELWREQTAFLWMGHSPRQQKGFEELIRDDWLAVRKAQQHIYDKAVKELERRKAAS